MKFGTAVTLPTSPSGDYSIGCLYLNTDTSDLWRLDAPDFWVLLGNLKGQDGTPGEDGEDGKDGQDGATIIDVSETAHVGLVHTYTITLSNGDTYDFYVSDGQSGSGSGDMTKAVYDKDNDGKVDAAEVADKVGSASTTVLENLSEDSDGDLNYKGNKIGGAVKVDGATIDKNTSNELTIASSVAKKLVNLDSNGEIDYSHVKNAPDVSGKIDKPNNATEGQVLTFSNNQWIASDVQGGGGGFALVITTNDELNGKMLTATKGSVTKQGLVMSNQCKINLTEGGVWQVEEPINHHVIKTDNMIYYGEYQYRLSSYTLYGFHVNSDKSNPTPSDNHEADMVSYHVKYNGIKVDNYDYDYAYMDFTNDKFVWGTWKEDDFFIPRPVLLKQDFTDKIYLNPNDVTKDIDGESVNDKLTGTTDGYNAMVEFGRNGNRIWYKVVPDSVPTSYTVYISDTALDDGFHAWSFYDYKDELMEHFYVAMYNGSNVSNVLRSLSGKGCINSVAGATEIAYAKANRKNGEEYSWYIDVYADRVLINFLMVLMLRSVNSDRIGYGNYTGGSSASSLLTTGQGNTKGLFYGKQSNSVVKVFGIENFFANQWRRCAGYSLVNGIIKYKLTYGTADGSNAKGYIEDNNAPTNYLSGNSIPTNLGGTYISKETARLDGSLLPSEFSGASSTTYYCDGSWSASGVLFALVGGTCDNSSACGAFCVALGYALSHASWGIGAALSCKPPC